MPNDIIFTYFAIMTLGDGYEVHCSMLYSHSFFISFFLDLSNYPHVFQTF